MKFNWYNLPELTVGLFFTFFFVIYIGKFGLTNLIIEESNTWHVLFNIGAWMVLTLKSMDILMDGLNKTFVKEVNDA